MNRPHSLGASAARELYEEDAGRTIYDALMASLKEPIPIPSAQFMDGFYGTHWDDPDYTELDKHARRVFARPIVDAEAGAVVDRTG